MSVCDKLCRKSDKKCHISGMARIVLIYFVYEGSWHELCMYKVAGRNSAIGSHLNEGMHMTDRTHTMRNLLVAGMTGIAKSNAAAAEIQAARSGAYVTFVSAAAIAESVAEFVAVADDLFAEIRKAGTLTDADGNTYPAGAKPADKGEGFTVPGSFSTAKSVVTDALTRKIPVTEDGKVRSFTSIRKDVQAAKAAEAEANAKGDDRIRLDTLKMLADLTARAKDATSAELADLYKRVKRAATPPQPKAEVPEAQAEAQAEALAAAA